MATPGFLSAGLPSPERETRDGWSVDPLIGRLVEISGHRAAANLTVAFGLVREAQAKDDPVAWVTLRQSTFFPPDVADSGVDLGRLAVVRVEAPLAAFKATVELTRSGGFGLVVLDLGPEAIQEKAERAAPHPHPHPHSHPRRRRSWKNLSVPFVTKLVGLAQKTQTAVVVLTEKTRETSSLSSLVSLRAEVRRDPDRPCEVSIDVIKDKRRGPGRSYREVFRAPAGLR
jgi:recombination protein RecA